MNITFGSRDLNLLGASCQLFGRLAKLCVQALRSCEDDGGSVSDESAVAITLYLGLLVKGLPRVVTCLTSTPLFPVHSCSLRRASLASKGVAWEAFFLTVRAIPSSSSRSNLHASRGGPCKRHPPPPSFLKQSFARRSWPWRCGKMTLCAKPLMACIDNTSARDVRGLARNCVAVAHETVFHGRVLIAFISAVHTGPEPFKLLGRAVTYLDG